MEILIPLSLMGLYLFSGTRDSVHKGEVKDDLKEKPIKVNFNLTDSTKVEHKTHLKQYSSLKPGDTLEILKQKHLDHSTKDFKHPVSIINDKSDSKIHLVNEHTGKVKVKFIDHTIRSDVRPILFGINKK
ncbi:hypothetical protein ACTFIY_011442 [Dictyostelium cf. discoideum]